MAAFASPLATVEEYLAMDRAAETRGEYYDGVIYAMSGGSYRHAIIIGNLQATLHGALRNGPCAVTPMEVRVRTTKTAYVYPDIVIVCEEPKFADNQQDVLLNPTTLIEALSPSTERHDRGLKSARYRKVESLQEYALVSQDEARVEIFRRQAGGEWLLSEAVGLEATCTFHCNGQGNLSVEIPLAAIYERVTLPSEPIIP
jgi:Uma2 family endonuclease